MKLVVNIQDPNNNLLFGIDKDIIKPNYNFDLRRLAITILDVCGYDANKEIKENISFIDFINSLTLTDKRRKFIRFRRRF